MQLVAWLIQVYHSGRNIEGESNCQAWGQQATRVVKPRRDENRGISHLRKGRVTTKNTGFFSMKNRLLWTPYDFMFVIAARDADEKEKWIEALENTILRHSQPALVKLLLCNMLSDSRREGVWVCGNVISNCFDIYWTVYPLQKWEQRASVTMSDFDKKLAETDAYLQILIDQVQVIMCHSIKFFTPRVKTFYYF